MLVAYVRGSVFGVLFDLIRLEKQFAMYSVAYYFSNV